MSDKALRLLVMSPNFSNLAKATKNSIFGDIKKLTNFHRKLILMLIKKNAKVIYLMDFGDMFDMFIYSFKPEI